MFKRWLFRFISAAAASLLLLAAILLIPLPSPILADGPGDWPMFHHDPAHTVPGGRGLVC